MCFRSPSIRTYSTASPPQRPHQRTGRQMSAPPKMRPSIDNPTYDHYPPNHHYSNGQHRNRTISPQRHTRYLIVISTLEITRELIKFQLELFFFTLWVTDLRCYVLYLMLHPALKEWLPLFMMSPRVRLKLCSWSTRKLFIPICVYQKINLDWFSESANTTIYAYIEDIYQTHPLTRRPSFY